MTKEDRRRIRRSKNCRINRKVLLLLHPHNLNRSWVRRRIAFIRERRAAGNRRSHTLQLQRWRKSYTSPNHNNHNKRNNNKRNNNHRRNNNRNNQSNINSIEVRMVLLNSILEIFSIFWFNFPSEDRNLPGGYLLEAIFALCPRFLIYYVPFNFCSNRASIFRRFSVFSGHCLCLLRTAGVCYLVEISFKQVQDCQWLKTCFHHFFIAYLDKVGHGGRKRKTSRTKGINSRVLITPTKTSQETNEITLKVRWCGSMFTFS